LFDIFAEFKVEKKVEGIYPLFQFFFDKADFCYAIKGYYYTYIKNRNSIAVFKNVENKKLPEHTTFKEIGIDVLYPFLKNLNDKMELNFVASGKYDIVETLFVPVVALLLIFNLVFFTFLTFKKNNLNDRLNKLTTQVSQELKDLEPFQKASDKYEEINKVINAVSKFKETSFPFNELIKKLSQIKLIWIRQISLSNNNLLISGKAESAFAVLEIVKKMNFLENAKINSKIIRDNKGFERFTIMAKYKNVFKN